MKQVNQRIKHMPVSRQPLELGTVGSLRSFNDHIIAANEYNTPDRGF